MSTAGKLKEVKRTGWGINPLSGQFFSFVKKLMHINWTYTNYRNLGISILSQNFSVFRK